MKNYKIIKPTCMICGKRFKLKIRDDGKILTPCFHSYLRKHIFMGWSYEVINFKKKNRGFDDSDFKVIFKNKFWKFIGYTELQRTIVYFIWDIFHKGKIKYWECGSCSKK